MGAAEYKRQFGDKQRLKQFTPTVEHRRMCQAMSDVWGGIITPEQGMALLWDYDVMQQRLSA